LQILERENKPPKNNNHAKSLKKRVRKRPTKFSMQILWKRKSLRENPKEPATVVRRARTQSV
jgi:hypothetical protein